MEEAVEADGMKPPWSRTGHNEASWSPRARAPSFFQIAPIIPNPSPPGPWARLEKYPPVVRPNTPIASTHSRPWREITVLLKARHTAAYRIVGEEVAK
jgi:hypothetical protein